MTDQPEDKRGEASEQTRARAQMEEWMNVWQSSVDPIDELREDFLERTNKTRTLNLVGIVFLMLCGLMLIINAILRPEPFTITVAVMCVPFVTYISARLYKWQQLYRRAPPMTPASYLATMRLHLEVKRAQHRWDQRFWPVSVIGPAVIIIWALIRTDFALSVVLTVFLVGGPAYSWGLWESFYNYPRKLEEEARRLDELERDLEL